MKPRNVRNKETNKIVFTGTLSECQAFLAGMYFVDSSSDSLWNHCFIDEE